MTKRAILLIDHGSRREAANRMLDEMAAMVQAEAGQDVVVRGAHMEIAEPSVASSFAACVEAGADEVVAHPFMLSPGRHATEDIPRLVKEAAAQHPGVRWKVTAPLGLHPLIAKVILSRCEEVGTGSDRTGRPEPGAT